MERKNLFWLPRFLAIVFILFISSFALDVFSGPNWGIALLMHLIPSIILTLITIIAWKKRKLGGVLFLIMGLFSVFFFRSLIITIPVLVIGLLFFWL